MFEWFLDFYHYIGWVMYAGMLYFVSSIYNTLLAIPDGLLQVLENNQVENLYKITSGLFFSFLAITLTVAVLSSLLDWNTQRLLGQVKKMVILCVIVISLPMLFREFAVITNTLIGSTSPQMVANDSNKIVSETNQKLDLGVIVANLYLFPNEECSTCQSNLKKYPTEPIESLSDILDEDIINKKGKDKKGDEVYAYKYVNSLLGIIFNLALIILLILTTFKVYGYLFNIIVIKIWIPIKMIYDGFNDTPISESIYEVIASFVSFAVQLIIIPFSVVMVGIMSEVSDNIFLQMASLFVAIWFMFTGVEYIQSKFQTSSGVPTVMDGIKAFNTINSAIDNGSSLMNLAKVESESGIEKILDTEYVESDNNLLDSGRTGDNDLHYPSKRDSEIIKYESNEDIYTSYEFENDLPFSNKLDDKMIDNNQIESNPVVNALAKPNSSFGFVEELPSNQINENNYDLDEILSDDIFSIEQFEKLLSEGEEDD